MRAAGGGRRTSGARWGRLAGGLAGGGEGLRGVAGVGWCRRGLTGWGALDVIVDGVVRDEELVDGAEEGEHERRVEGRVNLRLPRLRRRRPFQVGQHALLLHRAGIPRLRPTAAMCHRLDEREMATDARGGLKGGSPSRAGKQRGGEANSCSVQGLGRRGEGRV